MEILTTVVLIAVACSFAFMAFDATKHMKLAQQGNGADRK